VRNIGESGLPEAANSSCHCSTAKREKSEVEICKEWMIPCNNPNFSISLSVNLPPYKG